MQETCEYLFIIFYLNCVSMRLLVPCGLLLDNFSSHKTCFLCLLLSHFYICTMILLHSYKVKSTKLYSQHLEVLLYYPKNHFFYRSLTYYFTSCFIFTSSPAYFKILSNVINLFSIKPSSSNLIPKLYFISI